jgi:hypothetical protein
VANRFWVTGGTGVWNSTTNWSTTSGGASGAAVPTAGDDVFFDTNSGSGTATINVASNCHSLDFTGFTGTFACSATRTLNMGGSATLTTACVLTLGAGMTWNTGAGTFTLNIDNRSGGTTVTTNGKTLTGVSAIFTDTTNTAAVNFTDNFNAGTAAFTHQRAVLTIASTKTMTCGNFSITSASTKTLDWSGANLTCTSFSVGGTVANATLTSNASSTLTVNGNSASFTGASKTYNGTVQLTGSGIMTITDSNTFANTFSRIGSAGKIDGLSLNANQTISGTLNLTGNTQTSRLLVFCNNFGTARTQTVRGATVNATNADFRDITSSGVTITGTSLGDCGGNTSITFTSPVTRFWVGGTGNWSDTTHWSSSSGGASGATMPLAQDSIIFNTNSFSANGQTATFDVFNMGTLSTSSATNFSHTLSLSNGAANIGSGFYGDVTLSAQTTMAATLANLWNMNVRGTQTWTSNGATLTPVALSTITLNNTGGTFVMADDFSYTLGTANTGISINSGTLAPQGNLTCDYISAAGSFTGASGKTLTLKSPSGTLLIFGSSITTNSMNVAITDTGASDKTFDSGLGMLGTSWGDVTITTGGIGKIIFALSGGHTFKSLNTTGGSTKTIQFANGQTYTLTNPTFFRGASGNLVTVQSNFGGSAFTLACSFPVNTDYISLQDCTASGATPFYAGSNSTNVSGNTNWVFGQPGQFFQLF